MFMPSNIDQKAQPEHGFWKIGLPEPNEHAYEYVKDFQQWQKLESPECLQEVTKPWKGQQQGKSVGSTWDEAGLKAGGGRPHLGSRNNGLNFPSSLYPSTISASMVTKQKQTPLFSLCLSLEGHPSCLPAISSSGSGGCLLWTSPFLKETAEIPLFLSQAYFIPIHEIVAKAKSSKKTTDRWCIEKLMRIKHGCLSFWKKGKEYQTVCLFEKKKGKKKVTVKITKGFPSLTKRNVKSVMQSPEKLLLLPLGSPR